MAVIDPSYLTKVGRQQEGEYFFVKSDGYFKWNDTDVTGNQMKLLFLSQTTVTMHSCSTGTSTVSTVSTLAPAYGYHLLEAATAVSLGSWDLPVPAAGAMLTMNFADFAGDANASVLASTGGGGAGVSLISKVGVALSSLEISAAGWIQLVCETAGIWAIVEDNASVTERAAA